ncbi:MAG: alkaline phosphatase family protein, partial [Pseudomonadota bacterium]
MRISLVSLVFCFALSGAQGAETPRLVVLVVVDQLHPELLARHAKRFDEDGGFNRFLDNGLRYREAYVDHFLTLTGPGHASISTGATPSQHGIVGNYWYDEAAQAMTSSVSDGDYRTLGSTDPASGVSPKKLRARTFADQLYLSTGGKGKTLTFSAKDRGAVLIAGEKGKALWYSTETGRFVSSSYYFEALPTWVKKFNQKNNADTFDNVWTLMHEPRRYRIRDFRNSERPYDPLGREFPHNLGNKGSEAYYRNFKRIPYVDELTLKLALAGVEAQQLGKDKTVDLLSVSLSATDYVGHDFGPLSRESEDNLYRLDRSLAHFMDRLEKQVSSKHILYVLTADHGVDASPEHRHALGLTGHRLDVPVLTTALNLHLKTRFGGEQDIVKAAVHTGVYFDPEAIEGISSETLFEETKNWLMARPGIEHALILPYEKIPDAFFNELLRKQIYPPRIGQIFIVPAYGTFFGYPANAATHGTPYQYDRHIPMMFLTPKRKRREIWTPVSQRSIAPTLSAILGVTKPSGATAAPLSRVVKEYQ